MEKRSFGHELEQARRQLNWTQAELAARSNVAVKTIYRLEASAKEGADKSTTPRAEIVAKLAVACGKDASNWLKLTGHQPPSQEFLEQVEREVKQKPAARGVALQHLFDDLEKKANEDVFSLTKPSLMCVCYASKPTGAKRMEIIPPVSRLIERGLHLAMFSPFPQVTAPLRYANWCAKQYGQVLDEVISLAQHYKSSVSSAAQHRIRLFIPTISNLLIVPPPASFEIRPTFIKLRIGSTDPEHNRLGVLVEMPGQTEPVWYDMEEDEYNPPWTAYFQVAVESMTIKGWQDIKNPSWTFYDFETFTAKVPPKDVDDIVASHRRTKS